MRDDDASHHTDRPLPLAVMVQPDPMLEERPASPSRLIATALGAVVIVMLALYGMMRPAGQQEMAAAPETQTAPAGGGAANNAGGQAQPANVPAQNPQPNPQQPTTTGQGSGGQAGQPDGKGGQSTGQTQGQATGQAGQSKTPPASGGSATSATGPGARPAPEAR